MSARCTASWMRLSLSFPRTVSSSRGKAGMEGNDLAGDLKAFIAEHEAELIEFRRDLHAHPEVGYAEHRATRRAALRPVILPKGTGMIVDIGGSQHDNSPRRVVALRADIDALPMADEKSVPY